MKQRNRYVTGNKEEHLTREAEHCLGLWTFVWFLSWEESVLSWLVLDETIIGKNYLGLYRYGQRQRGFDSQQITLF